MQSNHSYVYLSSIHVYFKYVLVGCFNPNYIFYKVFVFLKRLSVCLICQDTHAYAFIEHVQVILYTDKVYHFTRKRQNVIRLRLLNILILQ